MADPLRLVFAGTPEFAVPPLQALVAGGHELAAVFTQPDRPAGRGRRMAPPPVKRAALEAGLAVQQPDRLERETLATVAGDRGIDALVVVAFGQVLPPPVLSLARIASINVHASLLPRWRGPAPIARALLAGDRETGVSVMQMHPGVDAGPVLLRRGCPIHAGDTAPAVHDRLARLGADALAEVCGDVRAHLEQAEPQDEAAATHAPKLTRAEGELDWFQSAAQIERRVRALQPWPAAWTTLDGAIWRLWGAEVVAGGTAPGATPGTVVACGPNGIDVVAGDGYLRLVRVQPEGRRAMGAADVANARDLTGCRFGT